MPAKFPTLFRAILLAGIVCSLNGQILFGPKRATPKPAAPKKPKTSGTAKPKVKPKHTATAKQRAEAERKKRKR